MYASEVPTGGAVPHAIVKLVVEANIACGTEFIVTDFCVAAAEQVVVVIVSVTSTVPVPAEPHVTVIELPVPLVGVPPTTLHKYVCPDTLVTL